MKTLFIAVALMLSATSFASTAYKCQMNFEGEQMFFSVLDLKQGLALIGYAGTNLDDADDEFKLRLQQKVGDTFVFSANVKKDYSGYMIVYFNPKNLTQTVDYFIEGKRTQFSGKCKKI